MATTTLFAEILVIGFQVMAWLALFIVSIFGIDKLSVQTLKGWENLLILPMVAIAYVLGIIFDRIADILFFKFKDIFSSIREVCLDIRTKSKWWHFININFLFNSYGKFKSIMKKRKRIKSSNDFRKKRLRIMKKNETVAKFIEYHRSRFRIARSTVLNLPLIVIASIVFLLTQTDFSWLQILLCAIIGILLVFISIYAAYRIYITQEATVKAANEEVLNGK